MEAPYANPYEQHHTPDTREACNCCGALCEPEHLSEDGVCPDCQDPA